jgi:hypothetical protein
MNAEVYRKWLKRLTDDQLQDEYLALTECTVHSRDFQDTCDQIDQIRFEIDERDPFAIDSHPPTE